MDLRSFAATPTGRDVAATDQRFGRGHRAEETPVEIFRRERPERLGTSRNTVAGCSTP